ncbi:LodA/GoxA family CTQ-dependent oxidase [Planktotalea sp.]|uniref:LodA/GoxA family CTQ-dependent oxidase n=1 Tax=Planktotalea sp. TaxID=2029877 RepID=UPI003D6A2CC1
MTTILRIHPAIGVSRVGNAEGYIIAPETSAGMPGADGSPISGGLPIKPGEETATISDKDLRDSQGRLKPHAQRFRIFAYADTPTGYPYTGEVSEVCIGSVVDGKTVESITWQVHMANKKSNNWVIPESPPTKKSPEAEQDWNHGIGGMAHYAGGNTPNVRNATFNTSAYPVELNDHKWGLGGDPADVDMSDPVRLTKLVIDAGPKTINTSLGQRVEMDDGPCTYIAADGSVENAAYPQLWPANNFETLLTPNESQLGTMGGLETDAQGRLLVIGAPGYAASWSLAENNPSGAVDGPPDWQPGTKNQPFPPPALDDPFPLWSDIDNDGWLDDAGDGPITAALHFQDGSSRVIDVPAWCICADPAYAPQVRNVVSIWDEVYNSWLRAPELKLDCTIYDADNPDYAATLSYNPSYQAEFEQDVWPMFRAAHLQMFTTDLNSKAIGSHKRISSITPSDDPEAYLRVKDFIRNPNITSGDDLQVGAPMMPLALGDTGGSFLTVTKTQYFFLEQWYAGTYNANTETLTAGELLDKNTLTNLLGGRFSPGIDLTFIVRDPYLYNQDWKSADVGTFRIAAKPLDYANATTAPFLSVGYTPNRTDPNSVEPGDLSKFMALPWHTDYNSCATHLPAPNPSPKENPAILTKNNTLFWSWPAQRPVSVYTYEDYQNNNNAFYAEQRFSVRGTGTQWVAGNPDPEVAVGAESVGRYQDRVNILTHWFNIGTVIQGPAIEGFEGEDTDLFLEVESLLTGPSDWSQPWPIQTTDKVYPDTKSPVTDE